MGLCISRSQVATIEPRKDIDDIRRSFNYTHITVERIYIDLCKMYNSGDGVATLLYINRDHESTKNIIKVLTDRFKLYNIELLCRVSPDILFFQIRDIVQNTGDLIVEKSNDDVEYQIL